MRVTIKPGKAMGTVAAPSSKSVAHRLLICAGLSDGESCVHGVDMNEDICATMDCLRAMGASCVVEGSTIRIRGIDPKRIDPVEMLCCRESGSTLRFFIPLALLCGKTVSLTGTEKLLSRPLTVYKDLCDNRGMLFEQDRNIVRVSGKMTGGIFEVPGDISSQFITGLLFALPLCEADSEIRIAPPVESRGYINLTLQALEAFGICAKWKDEYTLYISGNQHYIPAEVSAEGDYSGAAFFAALRALGNDVDITGLRRDSLQGDKVYDDYFPQLCAGAPVLPIGNCPDLGPILFALAAAKNGGVFTGTRRLKIKESDRAAAMAEELSAFGTEVIVNEDDVIVRPKDFHAPDRVLYGHNDHRIVMSLAVLLTLTGGSVEGAQAVRKSFPDFFERLQSLGVEVSVYEADQ